MGFYGVATDLESGTEPIATVPAGLPPFGADRQIGVCVRHVDIPFDEAQPKSESPTQSEILTD